MSDAPDPRLGVWTGLLKWSLAQHNIEPQSEAKPMSDEDKQFLKQVFDTLVVDEAKRMKIIVEILRMPEDEAGIRRLLQESAAALQKLQDVPLSRDTEIEHYGGAAPKPAAAAPSTLAPPTSAAGARSASPDRSASASPRRSPSPPPPPPTPHDYQNASVPALLNEMVRRKQGALEELDDRCLTSDNANDFMFVGGLEPLLISLLSNHDGIRWRAAQAISTIVQNNPKAQLKVFEHRALDYLIPLIALPQHQQAAGGAASASSSSSSSAVAALDPHSDAWTVVVKALTAVSALIRSEDLPAIRGAFIQAGGLERLVALLNHEGTIPRVQTKLFNLLKHILAWFPQCKARAVQLGMLPAVVRHVGTINDDISHREGCVRLLLEFARPSGDKDAQAAAKLLRDKGLGLKDRLTHRIKQLKALKNQEDKDQAEEELTLCTALVKACKF